MFELYYLQKNFITYFSTGLPDSSQVLNDLTHLITTLFLDVQQVFQAVRGI